MQTLIILGNGFDLDLGWKTSYKDFFQAEQDSFYQYNNLSYIKQMIEGECWYNLEGYLRQCVLNVGQTEVKLLNDFWQICSNLMLDYFSKNISKFKRAIFLQFLEHFYHNNFLYIIFVCHS